MIRLLDNKITIDQVDSMMAPLEQDLLSLFKVLEEQMLREVSENQDVQPEELIQRLVGLVGTEAIGGLVVKSNRPVAFRDFAGLRVGIENPRGTVRQGTDENGHEWSIKMGFDYGFVDGVEAYDGDSIDVYLGPNPEADMVYGIKQIDPNTGQFDEYKYMLGFDTRREAVAAFLNQYDRPGFFGGCFELPLDRFRKIMVETDIYKAQEGDKKTIFGKPATFRSGEWVVDEQKQEKNYSDIHTFAELTDQFKEHYESKPEYEKAVKYYAGSGYQDIRQFMRGELSARASEIRPIVETLEDYIESAPPIPDGIPIYRGMFGGNETLEQIAGLEVGDAFQDVSFASFSTNPDIAEEFTNPENKRQPNRIILKSVTNSQHKMVPPVKDIDEQELILQRNKVFVIKSKNKRDGYVELEVEIADEDEL